MNGIGFASTYSLVDLLDELPLPKALNLKDNDSLINEPLDIRNAQELQDTAAIIAPAIQMARLPSDLDRLRFKDSRYCPAPNMRNHHAQATPLMSLVVTQYNQFRDIMTVPSYQMPQVRPPQPPLPQPPQQQQQQQQQPPPPQQQFQDMSPVASYQYSPVRPQPPPPQSHQQPPPPQQLPLQPQHQQFQDMSQVPAYQYPANRLQPPPPSPSHQQHQKLQQPIHQSPMHQQHHPQQAQHLQHTQQYLQHPQHPQHPQPQQQQQFQNMAPAPPYQYPPARPQPPPHHPQHPQHQPYRDMSTIPTYQASLPQVKPQIPRQSRAPRPRQPRPQPQPQLRPKVKIDTKNSSYEEVLEKFLQETISDQMGNMGDSNNFYNFSPTELNQLVTLASKLKKKNRTKSVNLNKLTSLMTTLTSQLQVQTEVLKNNSYKDESSFNSMDSDEETEQNGTSDNQRIQKFETCCDCAVIALLVMTSTGMDSRIYLEECVEAIINFVNTALTIITDTTSGNFCSSPKKSNKNTNDRRPSKRILFAKSSLAKLNARCSEVLGLVNDLLICRTEATLNDSLLLSTSRAALTAFFLMDSASSSNELQLSALNVITAIFASYKNHQTVILEELIHSITRLPTTKRNRVAYQIESNNSQSISIFSALIMKLIQSLFTIRKISKSDDNKTANSKGSSREDGGDSASEYERLLKNQYNSALRASYAFLSSFLRRCCGVDKKDDCDYRVLFETFVEDLMTCLYKPDWSSAQLITHVLIKLLISNINPQPGKKNQQATNQTLKLASLEHLGTICARLMKEKSLLHAYKEEVKKALNVIDLSSLPTESRSKRLRSKKLKKEVLDDSDTEDINTKGDNDEDDLGYESERKILSHRDEQKFWLALLTFCQREKGITRCGRNIFCAIWLKELERRAKHQYEINNPTQLDSASISDDEESQDPQSNNSFKQYSRNNVDGENQKSINGPPVEDIQADMVRDFFKLFQISSGMSTHKRRDISNEDGNGTPESADEDSTIDEGTAENIIKLLDVSLPTTQRLIDAALSHIMAALSSTANSNIRTKATKSLSHILNDAPMDSATKLLARDDLQRAIGASLLDQSILVRDSTIELIGRFILNSQSVELIDKYYDMLTNRIMDSGVAVRKRVIKILRDICVYYPTYPRVPEICSIIIKRINDEGEGIRKLVSETFTQMWFKEERTHEAIVAKVACIMHVVATVWSKIIAEANSSAKAESHFEWLHQLLSSLLTVKNATDEPTAKRKSRGSEAEPTEDGEVVSQEKVNVKQTLAASTQIISVLVSEELASISQDPKSRADYLAAMTTLWSFAKVSPLLLAHHLDLFQSFLNNIDPATKSSFDLLILEKIIQIIELISPSISNPGDATTQSIEKKLGKLIFVGSINIVPGSVSCLSEIIHRHTKNEQLASGLFAKFMNVIQGFRQNPNNERLMPYIQRALYTCGLLCKHFDMHAKDTLYSELVRFVEIGMQQMIDPYATYRQNERILLRSLEGLGFMFERSPTLMLRESTTKIYKFFMRRAMDSVSNEGAAASTCVITNLRNYLQDEVSQEIKSASSIDWSRENLKEMTSSRQEDANSTQSSVIQLYLRDMLSCALSSNIEIRRAAIKLIHSVHNGGHISPLSIVPSLIALSSDDDPTIRIRADHILQEIERKYSNFVNMKSKQGVLESFVLNRRKRGYHRLDIDKLQAQNSINYLQSGEQATESQSSKDYINISAKLSTLYTVVASTSRQQRRAFILALLRYFDQQTLVSARTILSPSGDTNESTAILSKCHGSDIILYVTDNLIFLPFNYLDEPFFLVHQIGISLSNLVSQAVSQFREMLDITTTEDEHEHEHEDAEQEEHNNELDDLPVSIMQLTELVSSLHRCNLLMHCRRAIWDLYGITEQKFEDYTPNESTKVTDKPTHRRPIDEQTLESLTKVPPTTAHFDSEPFIRSMYSAIFGFEADNLDLVSVAPNRRNLKLEYKRFAQMMTK